MRIGDKILIISREVTLDTETWNIGNYAGIHLGSTKTVLRKARVTFTKFDRGKRPIAYRTVDPGRAIQGTTYGRFRGIFWCYGWDASSPEASALLVAASLSG